MLSVLLSVLVICVYSRGGGRGGGGAAAPRAVHHRPPRREEARRGEGEIPHGVAVAETAAEVQQQQETRGRGPQAARRKRGRDVAEEESSNKRSAGEFQPLARGGHGRGGAGRARVLHANVVIGGSGGGDTGRTAGSVGAGDPHLSSTDPLTCAAYRPCCTAHD